MKTIILCLLLAVGVTAANAQTEKGDWMVGGGFRLNTSDNNTEISLSPSAAAFIIHNLAVGGNVNLSYAKAGSEKVTSFGIGPMLRYYFTNANVRPLLQGSIDFTSTKTSIPSGSTTNSGVGYFLGGGAAIFISSHVSIDGLMGYDHSKINGFDGSGGFAMTIGFQVYLHKRQVERLHGR